MTRQDEQYDTLPPAIIDALRELDGPAVLPDAQRDAAVLSGARQHLVKPNRKRRNLRLFIGGSAGGALAAAAMLAITFYLGDPTGQEEADMDMALQDAIPTITLDQDNTSPPTTANASDLDDNGRIDILDAYALARKIEQGAENASLDLDGNGSVDQRDIDFLANQVVALNHGEQG